MSGASADGIAPAARHGLLAHTIDWSEAQAVADKSTGQAATALVELAEAYAAMASPAHGVGAGTGRAIMWTSEEVGQWGAQDYSRALTNTTIAPGPSAPEADTKPPTAAEVSEGIRQTPATITVSKAPAVANARDQLLAAIGAEAEFVAAHSPGHTAAVLAELARAYALVTADLAAVATPLPATGRALQVVSQDSKNDATLLVTPAAH
ncbi:hypothetical protein [Streptomyces violascens]|uniref:hypothetical protein n=1 Tax=Streptomyces violascens TaxID=67381 RepID=UPI003679DB79